MISNKIANSGFRVLEILKLLSLGPLSMNEIIKLNEDNENTGNVYAKETITKYLNTLRAAGFRIDKINGKFYLKTNITKLNLDSEDIKYLLEIKDYALSQRRIDMSKNISEFFHLLENSFDEETRQNARDYFDKYSRIGKYSPEESETIIQKFESFCKEGRKLKIKYNENGKTESYRIEPRDLIFRRRKVFLLGYHIKKSAHKEFLLSDIVEAVQDPRKSKERDYLNPVSFKIKGHLAKVYVPREGEKCEDNTILNKDEDREGLFRRLLRYRENCEVVYPAEFRSKMADYLDKILENYE